MSGSPSVATSSSTPPAPAGSFAWNGLRPPTGRSALSAPGGSDKDRNNRPLSAILRQGIWGEVLRDKVVSSPEEAIADLSDGASVAVTGFGSAIAQVSNG